MLSRYIEAALRQAQYEILVDGGGFYGSIPALAGVWAHADSLEECREELKSALEEWLLFSRSRRQNILPLDGIDLTVCEVA
jgi:predicted RNase H-like HicB family nuclease